jgi:hypothetical protein
MESFTTVNAPLMLTLEDLELITDILYVHVSGCRWMDGIKVEAKEQTRTYLG